MTRRISGAALKVVPQAPPIARAPRRDLKPANHGVVEQVRIALRPRARLASVVGFLLGGFIPIASFAVAHREVDPSRSLWGQVGAYLVAGGLAFSALTVFAWSRAAFRSSAKAFGFVLLLEGSMVASSSSWLGFAALAYLVAINGVATACNLHRGADR